jgi:hypothetical protein
MTRWFVTRRCATLLVATCLVTTIAAPGVAQADVVRPANDALSAAIDVTAMSGTTTGTAVYATHTADEPTASCGNGANNFVWWKQTVTSAADVRHLDTVASNFNTVLVVYRDTGSGLSEVTCNDDAYGTTQSSVTFTPTVATYYFGVAAYGNGSGGFVRLTHDFGAQAPSTTSYFTSITGTTDVQGWCKLSASDVPDRWYRFVDHGAPIEINTFGSDYDTMITVFSGVPAGLALCNDDTAGHGDGRQSEVFVGGTAGRRYYVLVSGRNTATAPFGHLVLNVNGVLGGTMPVDPFISPPPATATPTDAGAAADASGVTLTWSGPTGMSGFDIARGATEATAVTLASLDPATRSYVDTAPGTGPQHYWLYAVNGSGRGPAVPFLTTPVQLTPSANPSVVAADVTLTAAPVADPSATPTGTVTFRDGATVLGSVPLSGGTAQLTTSALSPGHHTLTAEYGGDATYAPSTSAAVAQQVEFSDVRAGAPFYSDIYWLTDHKLATGFVDGTFRPTTTVTRQAFAAYLYRYDHGGADAGACAPGTSPFPDVADNAPFCGDITWLAGTGITGGFADGTFRPTNPVARQAVAAFFYRYNHGGSDAGPCPVATSPYNDVPDSSPFCGDIRWLSTTAPQAITTGFADGGFHPTASAARQAVAAYFHRYDTDFAA